MTTETQTKNTIKNQKPSDVFNSLENQEIRKLVIQRGIYVRGSVEDYEYQGSSGKTGFIQILVPAGADTSRMNLMKIKVKEECYGLIDLFNTHKTFQGVSLQLEVTDYRSKVQYILTPDQDDLKDVLKVN